MKNKHNNSTTITINKGYAVIGIIIALMTAIIVGGVIMKYAQIVKEQDDFIDSRLSAYYGFGGLESPSTSISIEPLGEQFGPGLFDKTGLTPKVVLEQVTDAEIVERYKTGDLKRFVFYLSRNWWPEIIQDAVPRIDKVDLYYLTDKYKVKLVLTKTSNKWLKENDITVSGLESGNLLTGLDDLKVTLRNKYGTFELMKDKEKDSSISSPKTKSIPFRVGNIGNTLILLEEDTPENRYLPIRLEAFQLPLEKDRGTDLGIEYLPINLESFKIPLEKTIRLLSLLQLESEVLYG